jgi:hypothetical protein
MLLCFDLFAKNVVLCGVRASPGNIAFNAVSIILLLLAAGAVVGMVSLMAAPSLMDRLLSLQDNVWWLTYRAPGATGMQATPLVPWRIGAACAATLVSLAAALRGREVLRRTSSPAIPFIMMSLFSLGLECLRAGAALLFATDSPVALSILVTRAIYWGRFVGILSLLIAGLYCTDLKYRKFFLLAGGVLLVSFAMAAYIPIDRTMFLAQLTWKLGDEQSVWFLNLAIGILAIFTGGAAAFTRQDPRYIRLAIGLALLVVCREFQFFGVQPASLAAGLVMQAAGAVLFLRSIPAQRIS